MDEPKVSPNVFDGYIRSGEITDERALSRIYRQLLKAAHPDTATRHTETAAFMKIRADYEAARLLFRSGRVGEANEASRSVSRPDQRSGASEPLAADIPNFDACAWLFADLIAGNFPLDRAIRDSVRQYGKRMRELDRRLTAFGPEFSALIFDVEEELNRIRGPSVVSNHRFNLVKLYIYRISDYIRANTPFSLHYLRVSRDMMLSALEESHAPRTAFLFNWFVTNLLARK